MWPRQCGGRSVVPGCHRREIEPLNSSSHGYVDVHLLAAAMMERTPLWTLDRRLAAEAARMGIAA